MTRKQQLAQLKAMSDDPNETPENKRRAWEILLRLEDKMKIKKLVFDAKKRRPKFNR